MHSLDGRGHLLLAGAGRTAGHRADRGGEQLEGPRAGHPGGRPPMRGGGRRSRWRQWRARSPCDRTRRADSRAPSQPAGGVVRGTVGQPPGVRSASAAATRWAESARVRVMPSDMVRVIYRKYDGTAHRDYPARRLTEDDLGVWLGVTAGTRLRLPRPAVGGADPVRAAGAARGLVDGDVQPAAADQRGLLRHRQSGPLGRRRHGAPDRPRSGRGPPPGTGVVELRDEDEFAEHRVRFGYPDELVAEARGGGARICSARSATAPSRSRSAYRKWLALVV